MQIKNKVKEIDLYKQHKTISKKANIENEERKNNILDSDNNNRIV